MPNKYNWFKKICYKHTRQLCCELTVSITTQSWEVHSTFENICMNQNIHNQLLLLAYKLQRGIPIGMDNQLGTSGYIKGLSRCEMNLTFTDCKFTVIHS